MRTCARTCLCSEYWIRKCWAHCAADRTHPGSTSVSSPTSTQCARPFGSITKLVPSLRELPIYWLTASGRPGPRVRGQSQSWHLLAFKLNETSGSSTVEFYCRQHGLGISWTIWSFPFYGPICESVCGVIISCRHSKECLFVPSWSHQLPSQPPFLFKGPHCGHIQI